VVQSLAGGIDIPLYNGPCGQSKKDISIWLLIWGASMTLFKVTIFKRLDALDEPQWTNVYNVDALGTNTALDAAEGIAGLEMAVTASPVHVYRVTAKPSAGGDTAIRAVDIQGEVVVDPVNLVPFFNTVRVIFTDSVERSESKYLRAVISEANVEGFNISNELQTFVDENYAQPMLSVLGFRGPHGEVIAAARVQKLIQMRQVGWHRRTRPGYKRGWVPV
jgi:hypothetical protein